jgi:dipeptide/tripeptide permease
MSRHEELDRGDWATIAVAVIILIPIFDLVINLTKPSHRTLVIVLIIGLAMAFIATAVLIWVAYQERQQRRRGRRTKELAR